MFHDDTRGVGNREPYGRSLPVCIRASGPDYFLVRIHDAELAPLSNSGYIGLRFLVLISVTQGRVHDNRSGQGLPGYGGTESLTHGEVRVATITPHRKVPWPTPSVVFFGAVMTMQQELSSRACPCALGDYVGKRLRCWLFSRGDGGVWLCMA